MHFYQREEEKKLQPNKLDGIVPLIADPQPTSSATLFQKEEVKEKEKVLCDM